MPITKTLALVLSVLVVHHLNEVSGSRVDATMKAFSEMEREAME